MDGDRAVRWGGGARLVPSARGAAAPEACVAVSGVARASSSAGSC